MAGARNRSGDDFRARGVRFNQLLNDHRNGQLPAVFIDDFGKSGANDPSSVFYGWELGCVGVLVSTSSQPWLYQALSSCSAQLKAECGASEFHWTDLQAGKGAFSSLDAERRLDWFKIFAHLVTHSRVSVVHSRTSPSNRDNSQFNEIFGKLKAATGGEKAAYRLMVNLGILTDVAEHVATMGSPVLAVTDDFDQHPGGRVQVLPFLENSVLDGALWHLTSQSVLELQLADFLAFCLGRILHLSRKAKPSSFDVGILRAISPLIPVYRPPIFKVTPLPANDA